MTGGKYLKKRLWRWRGNPLQRRDDIVEAWIVLAVWTVFAVGGTVAGLVTFHAADEVFARQRAERQSVRAVLLDDVLVSTTAVGVTSDRRTTSVRWTAPDGSARTGRTLVDTGRKAGSRVTVWQDGQGRLTAAPRSSTEAAIESGFLGAAAAAASPAWCSVPELSPGRSSTGAVSTGGAGNGTRWDLSGATRPAERTTDPGSGPNSGLEPSCVSLTGRVSATGGPGRTVPRDRSAPARTRRRTPGWAPKGLVPPPRKGRPRWTK